MATLTTADFDSVQSEQEVNMARFVVTENFNGSATSLLGTGDGKYDGKVVDELSFGEDERQVVTVKFEDEAAGGAFSRRVNGSVYRAAWAAGEHARHVFTGSP